MISPRNVLFTTATLAAAASALQVASPASMVQCQPVQLSWSDGQAPFFVAIIPGSQPSAPALEQLPTQDGTSVTWMVDLAAGQEVTIKVTDSTGAIQYSSAVPIQAGTSTECSSSTTSGSSGSSSSSSSNDDDDDASSAAAADSSSSSSPAARAPASSSAASASAPTLAMSRQVTSRPTSDAAESSTGSARSSGIPAAAAAAASSPSSTGAATSVKAGLGMLVGGFILALAA